MDSQKKINIVALVGESGSGKDAILTPLAKDAASEKHVNLVKAIE